MALAVNAVGRRPLRNRGSGELPQSKAPSPGKMGCTREEEQARAPGTQAQRIRLRRAYGLEPTLAGRTESRSGLLALLNKRVIGGLLFQISLNEPVEIAVQHP